MPEQMISVNDYRALKMAINGLVEALADMGFSGQQIGAGMASIGLATHHANGGDFDQLVSDCRNAIENFQATKQ